MMLRPLLFFAPIRPEGILCLMILPGGPQWHSATLITELAFFVKVITVKVIPSLGCSFHGVLTVWLLFPGNLLALNKATCLSDWSLVNTWGVSMIPPRTFPIWPTQLIQRLGSLFRWGINAVLSPISTTIGHQRWQANITLHKLITHRLITHKVNKRSPFYHSLSIQLIQGHEGLVTVNKDGSYHKGVTLLITIVYVQ